MKTAQYFCIFTFLISASLGLKSQASDLTSEILEPDSYVKLMGSLDVINSELHGSGFKHDTSSDLGAGYILKIDHALSSEFGRIGFQYSNTDVEAESPNSISPTSVDIRRTEYSLYYKTAPIKSGFFKDSRLGVGYFIFEYDADQTTPNILITNQQVQGFSFSIDHDIIINSSLLANLGGGLYVPFKFNEEEANTGYYREYYAVYLSGTVDYSLGETSDFALTAGFHLQRDYAKFEGMGDRGSSNSEDIRYLFRIPIGLKYSF
ncbi:MAG: hypothetical protein AABZ31_05740 [Bdellovibrionota bacterium]